MWFGQIEKKKKNFPWKGQLETWISFLDAGVGFPKAFQGPCSDKTHGIMMRQGYRHHWSTSNPPPLETFLQIGQDFYGVLVRRGVAML